MHMGKGGPIQAEQVGHPACDVAAADSMACRLPLRQIERVAERAGQVAEGDGRVVRRSKAVVEHCDDCRSGT
jgi:hypothetical protein